MNEPIVEAKSLVKIYDTSVVKALGFRRRMIQLAFLLESSFIDLTAIVVGTLLALIVAVNVINDSASQSSWAEIAIVVPWANLRIIFAAVYAAALLATLGPAVRGSRVYPAEALRYE
jgi:putative ABC transport system permease protein